MRHHKAKQRVKSTLEQGREYLKEAEHEAKLNAKENEWCQRYAYSFDVDKNFKYIRTTKFRPYQKVKFIGTSPTTKKGTVGTYIQRDEYDGQKFCIVKFEYPGCVVHSYFLEEQISSILAYYLLFIPRKIWRGILLAIEFFDYLSHLETYRYNRENYQPYVRPQWLDKRLK